MVAGLHALGLKAGFYLGNCLCREEPKGSQGTETNYTRLFPRDAAYRGDVQLTRAAGFDSIKIDNCGPWINASTYYALSRPLMLEVNPWSPSVADRYTPGNRGPGYGVPDAKWCPYHMFRVSTDLNSTWASIWFNLQSMQPFSNISRPGCWAYADMLLVGKLASEMEDRVATCRMRTPAPRG